MYNILVADDEKFIADGLYDLIGDEFKSEVSVFKAYSGMQAIEICKKNHIDILFTDVCMPEIDGFELSKRTREMYPECRVIFLSAHSDFNYIQLAMRGNSVDYVVKAEGDEAIIASLRKALSDIDKKSKNALLIEKSHRNVQKAMPLLRKEYMVELLDGAECQASSLKAEFSELGICLDWAQPILILIGRIEFNDRQKRMNSICGIRNILQEGLPDYCIRLDIEYDHDKLVWLIQPKDDNHEYTSAADHIGKALDDFRVSFAEIFNSCISFAFNPHPVTWQHLSEAFYTLKLVFNRKQGLAQSSVFIQDDEEDDELDLEKFSRHQIYVVRTQMKRLESLNILLESRQEDEFNKLFDSITANIKICRKLSYYLLMEFYYEVALMFLSYINRSGIKESISKKIDIDLLMDMENHPSWDGTIEYFKDFAKAIFESGAEDVTETNKIILDIENYIDQNLASDVSLSAIADALHFNPSYLSRVFKQGTNKSLTEYITEARLKKVCKLLSDRRFKIYEIATMGGFESTSYFNRFFKKHMTLTPQEYRDRVTGSSGV